MNRKPSCAVLPTLALLLGTTAASFAQGHLITTIAGAGPDQVPALAFGLGTVRSVAVDLQGNLYVGSYEHNRIFKVDTLGILTAVAGNGGSGSSGDGGPATQATINQPAGVAVDGGGNVFFVDGVDRVRRVDAMTGTITTVAGGTYGFFGDGGPATQAGLRSPLGIALSGNGDFFIADQENLRIRKVDAATGVISTVAGDGGAGFNGDDIAATSASLFYPQGVTVDSQGNLLIADTHNHRVRRVDLATGFITTFAGNGFGSSGGDGSLATFAGLAGPVNVASDAAGNVYISDITAHRVRVVSPAGIINTATGTGSFASEGDGGPATAASLVPNGIATDSGGNLFIADEVGRRVRRVEAATGLIGSVAGNGEVASATGDGGPALQSSLAMPSVLALNAAGDVLIADPLANRVRRIERTTGMITTVAGNGTSPSGGDGGPATEAGFNGPTGLAVDAADNLFVIDQGVNKIRRVDAVTGVIATVAGSGAFGSCGDERPALEACFGFPWALAIDEASNLYVADTFNNRVARIDAADGMVRTVAGNGVGGFGGDGGLGIAASLMFPQGIAVDRQGRFVYIADSHNFRVRRLDTATGLIATVAGDGSGSQSFEDGVPATSVGIGFPWGISLDPEGSLLIADASGQIRRLVVSTGLLYRVAGSGVGFAGDGGPVTFAIFSEPSSVVADATGNLFIADKNNHRVRHVANDVPVANAGPDQALEAGVSTASLDGSASSDNDMDALRFEWRDETGAILGTAPTVEVAAYGGRHEFTLTVADGWGGRGIDTVAVTAPATVQVTQPGQGKVIWPIGSTQTIRWIHNLGPVSAVQLELSRDGGHTWEVLSPAIANADATSGSFDWVVTGPRTKTAVVRVSAPGLANASDATDTRLMIR